jgi:ABC-type branched-subunit amino acid transport system ATPase component/branched-subunit amino acid ABC-type transport system permease component
VADVLIFIIAGLTTGSVYALAAVGLVLTYKTSGIFNFAQGGLATAAAFLFYALQTEHGVPWPIAAAVCVFVAGPIIGVILEWVTRRVTTATLPVKVVATVGILLVLQAGLELIFPPGPVRQVPQYLPTETFSINGTLVQYSQLILFAFGIASVAVLGIYLRRSRTGLAMRAVVDDPELIDIVGYSPIRVRRTAWMIGSSMAAAAGVLIAPLVPLDVTTLTFLIVTAFGAAAIGGFSSLALTYLGGLIIGVAQALLEKYFATSTGLAAGLAGGLPFLILFGLLLVAPTLKRPSGAVNLQRGFVVPWRPPMAARAIALTCVTVVLALVPRFAGVHLVDWTQFLGYTILFLSLGLLVRLSGQVSLAHVTFMAIGVCAFSHLVVRYHWPWLGGLAAAALIAAPIGAILAIPAIRFPGLYLALATLGFGLLVEVMFYSQSYMFGTTTGLRMPTPGVSMFSSPSGYYYLVLIFTGVATALVILINGSRLGRLLRAMSDSPTGLRACGASINVSRVLVFSISAAVAAVAGVLAGVPLGLVGGDGYQPIVSLQLFVLTMLVVGGAPWFALAAAAGQVLIPGYLSSNARLGYSLTLFFGLSAVVFAVSSPSTRQAPARLRSAIDRLDFRFRRPRTGHSVPSTISRVPKLVAHTHEAQRDTSLTIEHLAVRFGGLIAVDNLNLFAQSGTITGLIGPNGAGKTTAFSACSGIVRPSRGDIRFGDRELIRQGPAARARLGIGRTFQHMELFDSLTVTQNVALGCEGAFAGWNPTSHIITTRKQREEMELQTAEAMALCQVTPFADTTVGALSTGQRRLVELARCVAGAFQFFLLDEPSSGLDQVETERFGEILQQVVRERKTGILLIEHDMTLVGMLCEYVYVLDFGRLIFEGTVQEIATSSTVQAAYLGEDVSKLLPDADADVVEA